MLAFIKAELAEDDELDAGLNESLGEDDIEQPTQQPTSTKHKLVILMGFTSIAIFSILYGINQDL